MRFKNYGLAPKSAADFAFLLHGFQYLKPEGVMAIILPHGVLFRGGAEERIRTKLLKDGNIDTVIGLPANLFFSTGIPVCILVLKKCKKPDDVLFINAAEHFEKGKRQNRLQPEDIDKILDTYQYRKEEERYSDGTIILNIKYYVILSINLVLSDPLSYSMVFQGFVAKYLTQEEATMKRVKEILQTKKTGIISIVPEATVFAALKLMSDQNVGALLVMEGEKLVGILSERDYARKVILEGKSSKETLVRDIMTEKVLFVKPDSTNEECMALMSEKCLRHLPVIESDRVIGMISIGDVVKAIISEQHFTINNLQQYIMQG
ncbi:MAG: N-6 DNA methylase [Desulfuromonadales bacterium]